jgi:hypothetical protein
MRDIIPINDPYDIIRMHRHIKQLLQTGNFELGPHAKKRMRERAIDVNDIVNIIKYGTITEVSPSGECWRYRIEGQSVERKRACCIVEINGRFLIITVFHLGKWSK